MNERRRGLETVNASVEPPRMIEDRSWLWKRATFAQGQAAGVVIMNKRHTNLWDRRSKSARTTLLDAGRTGEESAADGLADYLEERWQIES
jgi:hypothetical protein